MFVRGKKYVLTFTVLSLTIAIALIIWSSEPANSVTLSEICPKHDVSTGEYTSCFYCHNAESQIESGFTINTDSQFCLSCHDGSTADTFAYINPGSIAERISSSAPIGHMKGVDHPFSIGYTAAKNISPTLKLRESPLSGTVKLFNNKVECASCHDPHSCSNPLFLRISNERSKLCLACHDM